MKVAVVIVNFNSGSLLERCLRALADQTTPADEIIIVDNASDEPLSHQTLDEANQATVIRSETNLGYGGAINLAASKVEGFDYLCCLNPDAFPKPTWLEKLLDYAAGHPSAGSFASLMLMDSDHRVIDGAGDELHFSGIPWRRYHGRRVTQVTMVPERVFSACGGAAMYRLTAFRAIGGFDPGYFMYVDDIDLGFRLQLAGYECWFVPDAVVSHIGSAITGLQSDFSIYYGHRNLVYNYIKNMPLLLLILSLPVHLAANLFTLLIISIRGNAGAIARAKIDALASIPDAIRARAKTPAVVGSGAIWRQLSKKLLPELPVKH